jgi:uncharacterized protein YjiS (DUF1127 family)
MAITGYTRQTPASTGDRLLRLAGAGFARLIAAWRAMRNRRAVARLVEWDAAMLRDIGLTEGDVRSALATPFGDDPSYRLGVLSVERRAAFQATAREAQRAAANAERVRAVSRQVRSKSETIAAAHRGDRQHAQRRVLEI